MKMPWETVPVRPELIKDSVTELWPGQNHPLDIPDFLRRTPVIELENTK